MNAGIVALLMIGIVCGGALWTILRAMIIGYITERAIHRAFKERQVMIQTLRIQPTPSLWQQPVDPETIEIEPEWSVD